ncbi:MAG TPA: DNA recombination protein RmuC [Candidatus Marinimicrobia bacterium]|mgnify:FL=1|nr:DNA recombination protein RmuC [Candidatus Neomarinimicrobiota bacterium]HQH55425.1 DNA recombination protein RmuC [Candidatus Neomarinimicrobiota bacterium]HQK10810.1 DNA recombination protein RmuC [Candidatus Neomarinimicrobiota bacterium]
MNTDLFIIIGGLVIISLLVIIMAKVRKKTDQSGDAALEALKEKIIALESQLNIFPELVQSKTADIVQKRFTEFTDNVSTKNREMIEKFGNFQVEITKSLSENSKKQTEEFSQFKDTFKRAVSEDFEHLTKNVAEKLDAINNKVQENLSEGFKKTNETFTNVIERLAKIDEAQKNIESLSTNVVSLQEILSDKKSRGIFGEVQLNQVLYAIFGEKNDKIFQIQYTLSNDKTVDAILFLPEPIGNIPIDAKFTLDNYKRSIDKSLSEAERITATKLFKADVKKQIDEIADKYILPGETSNQAIMFIPAEAVFAELYAYHDDLIEYSHSRRVWLTSPTTFMAVLNTVQLVLRDIERRKYADIIQQEIMKLSEEFRRYRDRWNKLSAHIDTVQKDVKDIHTTSNKISNSFEKIAKVELGEKSELPPEQEVKYLNVINEEESEQE